VRQSDGLRHGQSVVNINSVGEANPERDEQIAERFEDAPSAQQPADEQVHVLVDTVPEGLTYADGQLSVDKGYDHEVLASFEMKTIERHATFWFTAQFFAYEDTWRRGLCWWQVPLQWVTLGFWSVVPTSYPCHPTAYRSKAAWVESVRTLAEVADATGVIMTYADDDQKEALRTLGFLVRLDPKVLGGHLKTQPVKMNSGSDAK
jgi:hypothetical protein